MSKNMTRKGLAFGAGLSLVVSGFAALPAQANGITGFIPVEPTTGPETALAITAGVGQTFSLTAEPTGSIMNGRLKWLITDPEASVVPTSTSSGTTAVTIADNGTATATANTDLVTFPWTKANGTYYGYFTSNLRLDDGAGAGDVDVITSLYTVKTITVSSNVASVKADIDISADQVTALGANADVDGASAFVQVSDPRAANNSLILDSALNTAGDAPVLELRSIGAAARSITVQAWVDLFDNDVIGSSEYVSAPVTISFVALADITATTSLTPPSAGDATLSARVTTSPMINVAEDGNSDLFEIVFTRQGSVTRGITTNASQDALTGVISGQITMGITADNITTWVDANGDGEGVETANGEWSDSVGILAVPTARNAAAIGAVSVSASKVASVTTTADHNLRTGDKITYASADIAVMNETAATVTVTGARTFTYGLSETTAVTAESDADETAGGYTVVTNGSGVSLVERVFAGDYSAQAALEVTSGNYKLLGSASVFGTQALAADDIVFTTVASSSVQGVRLNNDADDTDTDVLIRAGTTTATVTATVVDDLGAALGSGRRVDWTMEVGGFTTVKVNDRTSGTAAVTNASGQVTFTVTDTNGADGKKVTIKATPEGVAAAATWITLEWDTAAVQMYDLNVANSGALATGDRNVAVGASYDMAIFVADQWYQPVADADFRLAVTGSGVTEGFVPLVAGKATVKVTDARVATSFASTLTVQRKGTTGVFANTTTTATITTKTTAASSLVLGADATSLYAGVTVDTSDAVAKVALVERDIRTAFAAQPLYANDVVLAGKATNTTTGASLPRSVITVSGPTNILFSNGAVDKRGTITLVSDANGEFAVTLYSTTAQTNTVITVTANGVSATRQVTFTGIGVGEGTKLDVTTPANVRPASTFQVKAKLSDTFGNGVDTAAGRVKVTYTGPGIVFGTLPDQTDANGELMFSVLLGSNDTGNVVVTVSYDQNGDADYVDAKDLNTTKTITVGTGAAVGTGGTGKVNVGSFNGRLVVYAANLNGKRISWKVGGRWGSAVADSNFDSFSRPTPRAGATVDVEVFVDGVSTLKKSVVTR